MRIAIIAALPGELKSLVRHWPRIATGVVGTKKWVLSEGADTWVAVCAGMGADAARRAYATAASDGPLDMLLSVGWAGSLDAGVNPGTVHVPTVVIDAQTGEQFELTEGGRKWRLVTTARVADAAEKTRLAATYQGAVLVDMEAATVARLAAMHGIPLLCIKGVSDAAGARLPDLNRFIDRTGQMRLARFVGHVALRPQYWPSLLHLGRNSARAAEAMRDLILEFMKEKDVEKLIRTGSV
jgi:adenosylhomocysteine nucleosidase